MIRALVFDLGKVIIPFDFKRAYERMGALCDYPPEQIPERLRGYDLVQRLETGTVEPREFVRELREILRLECEYDAFCDIFGSIFEPETLIPESFLASLRERYRLVLLSNTNAIHFEFIEKRYPILQQFHKLILSHKVGAMKPSPVIFQAAIKAAQ